MEKSTSSLAKNPSLATIFMACTGGIILGFSAVFVRISDLGPMTTGFYRMLFALPLVYAWMRYEQKTHPKEEAIISKKDHVTIALAGIFFSVDLALWNWSIDFTTVMNSTLFNNTASFFVPLLLWIFFKESQPLRLVLGSLCGFLGCAVLASESFSISLGQLVGDMAALASGVMVASYVICVKKIRDRVQAGALMFYSGLYCTIGMLFFSFLFGETFWPLTRMDVFSIFGQAVIVHVIGQGLLAYAMGKIPASYGALIMLLAPATAAQMGWIFFGEMLSIPKTIGITIILISIISVKQRRQKNSSPR